MASIVERFKKRRERKKREKAFERGEDMDLSRQRAIVPDSDGTKIVDVPTKEESFVGPLEPTIDERDGGGSSRGGSSRGGSSLGGSSSVLLDIATDSQGQSIDPLQASPQQARTIQEQIEASRDIGRADLRDLEEQTISREGELVPKLKPTPGQAIVTAEGIEQEFEKPTFRQRLARTGGVGGLFAGLLTRDLGAFETPVSEETAFIREAEGSRQREEITFGDLQTDIELQRSVDLQNLQERIESEEIQKAQARISEAQELIQSEVDAGVTSIDDANRRLDALVESEQAGVNIRIRERFSGEASGVFEERRDIRPDIRGTILTGEARGAQTVFDIGASLNPLTGATVAGARTTQTPGLLTLSQEQLKQERLEQTFLIGGGALATSGSISRLARQFEQLGVEEALQASRFGRRGVTGAVDDVQVSLVGGEGRTLFGDVAQTRTLAFSQVDEATGQIATRGIELSAVSPRTITGETGTTIIQATEFGARSGVERLPSGLQVAVSEVTGRPVFEQTAQLGRRGRTIESFREFDEAPTRETVVNLFGRTSEGVQAGVSGRLTGAEVSFIEGQGIRQLDESSILFQPSASTITRPVRIPEPTARRTGRGGRVRTIEEPPRRLEPEIRNGRREIPNTEEILIRQSDEPAPSIAGRTRGGALETPQIQQGAFLDIQPTTRVRARIRARVSPQQASNVIGRQLGRQATIGRQFERQANIVGQGTAQAQRQALRQRQAQEQILEGDFAPLIIPSVGVRGRTPRLRPKIPTPRAGTPGIGFRQSRGGSSLLRGDKRGVSPTFTGQFLQLEEQLAPVSETQGLFVRGRRRTRAASRVI